MKKNTSGDIGDSVEVGSDVALAARVDLERYEVTLTIDNHQVYVALRCAVEHGEFGMREGFDWPVAILGNPKKPIGIVELTPPLAELAVMTRGEKPECQKKMLAYAQKLGPEAADILDVLAFTHHVAGRSRPDIEFSTDYFLALRGLKPRKGGAYTTVHGERRIYSGGYEPAARARISETVAALASLSFSRVKFRAFKDPSGTAIRGGQITGYEKREAAIVVKKISLEFDSGGYTGFNLWTIAPGTTLTRAFADGMVVEMPRAILHLNPVKYACEKALGRHLYYFWRVRFRQGNIDADFLIFDLLKASGLVTGDKCGRPGVVKARFLGALQHLTEHGIIAGSSADGCDLDADDDADDLLVDDHTAEEDPIGPGLRCGERRSRGWLSKWAAQRIKIKPLPHIYEAHEAYRKKSRRRRDGGKPSQSEPSPASVGVKSRREEKGITLESAAAELGLTVNLLGSFELGSLKPYPAIEKRMAEWLKCRSGR